MLTTRKVDSLKPKNRQYKTSDLAGLYLMTTPKGAKSWRYDYRLGGKYKTKTYGLYPTITVAEARTLHAEFREELELGVTKSELPTFDEVFNQWVKIKCNSVRNEKTKINYFNRYEKWVKPKIGDKPVDELPRKVLVDIVKSVDKLGLGETARKVSTLIRMTLDYAEDSGIIEEHSAAGLTRVLTPYKAKSMKCIDAKDAGKLMYDIDNFGEPVTRAALKLIAYSFTRTRELLLMEPTELIDEATWLVPAERMKMGIDHVVPLSKQAISCINEALRYTEGSKYIFESQVRSNKPMSENTLLFSIYRLGYRGLMTVHGFRALASTIINLNTKYKSDVIERQLAHKESDQVRAAYHRAEYLEERREMMQWYADFLDDEMEKYKASISKK